jgi:hypothetical protein
MPLHRVFVDPSNGTVTFAEWKALRDGTYVAYAVQDGGSDWRTILVLDVATGKVTSDVVQWARMHYADRLGEGRIRLLILAIPGAKVRRFRRHRPYQPGDLPPSDRYATSGRYVVLRNAVETRAG